MGNTRIKISVSVPICNKRWENYLKKHNVSRQIKKQSTCKKSKNTTLFKLVRLIS